MRGVTAALAIVATLLGVMAPETATAHGRGRVSVGVGFGFGGYWPGYWGGWPGWYAPYPYYYSPYYAPVVTTAPEPTRYIERGDNVEAAPAAAPRRDWWYFCPESKTYYPYVKQCAGGWQRVEPRPQDDTTNPER
jgi:hypothetical protein